MSLPIDVDGASRSRKAWHIQHADLQGVDSQGSAFLTNTEALRSQLQFQAVIESPSGKIKCCEVGIQAKRIKPRTAFS